MKRKSVPYLKVKAVGKRLVLRPYLLSDFKNCCASHAARLSPRNKFDEPVPTAKEMDYKKFKKRLLRHREHGKMRVHFIFGVFDKKSDAHVGQIDFFMINSQLRWANLGFHIQNQYFGQGYAIEAGRLALRMAFRLLDFHRLEAGMELGNRASREVAKNIGLKYEGKRKKFFPHKGGIDMHFYAENAIDYRRRR